MKKLPMQEAEFRGLARIARRLEFFRTYKGDQLETVLAHIQLYAFDRGETIFKGGEASDAFYLIYQGSVRIKLKSRFWGLIRTFAQLGSGDLFGEMGLLEHRKRTGTAIAVEPTTTFVLLREDFDKLVKTDPDFADLMQFISSRRKFETSH